MFSQPFSISIKDLNLIKNHKIILNQICCDIPSQSLTAIIGPNGAGKSTLLRSLLGFEKFESGEIFLGQKNCKQLSNEERAKLFSWCPSDVQLSYPFPCLDLVCMGRFSRHHGYPKKKDYEISLHAMKKLGLENFSQRQSDELSRGEFQKLMLARALASENPILIFDEPEAHLDLFHNFELLKMFKDLTREGYTICVCLHRLDLAAEYADHIILLKNGSVLKQGPSSEIYTPELVQRGFGIYLNRVKSTQGEKFFFEPILQNLSESRINDK